MINSLVLVLLLAAPPGPSAGGAAPLSIAYENGAFSARLKGADVTEVLREVALRARVEIRGRPASGKPVDAVFQRTSLHRTLSRVLDGQSFFILYAGARPVRVVLLGTGSADTVLVESPADDGPDPGAGTTSASAGGRDAASGEPAPEAVAEPVDDSSPLAASLRPVAVDGATAHIIGVDGTTFSEITGVAMRDPDPGVRAEALRVGLEILENEPGLAQSFLEVMEQRDDSALADWLRRVAGDNALEIARLTARQTRIPALRDRARAIALHLDR